MILIGLVPALCMMVSNVATWSARNYFLYQRVVTDAQTSLQLFAAGFLLYATFLEIGPYLIASTDLVSLSCEVLGFVIGAVYMLRHTASPSTGAPDSLVDIDALAISIDEKRTYQTAEHDPFVASQFSVGPSIDQRSVFFAVLFDGFLNGAMFGVLIFAALAFNEGLLTVMAVSLEFMFLGTQLTALLEEQQFTPCTGLALSVVAPAFIFSGSSTAALVLARCPHAVFCLLLGCTFAAFIVLVVEELLSLRTGGSIDEQLEKPNSCVRVQFYAGLLAAMAVDHFFGHALPAFFTSS